MKANSVRVFLPGVPQGIPFEVGGVMMVDGVQTNPPIVCRSIEKTRTGVAIDFSNGQRTVFSGMAVQFEYIGLKIQILMLKDRLSKKFAEVKKHFEPGENDED